MKKKSLLYVRRMKGQAIDCKTMADKRQVSGIYKEMSEVNNKNIHLENGRNT